MWLTAEAWRLELRLVSYVGGRRCFLAARENDSQRRGRPAGFGSKTHKAGERFWGRKQRKRWLLVWGGVLPKRSNGFSFSFLSKGRGQPYPAAESQALGWREEEKNLNRIGGWRLRVKEKKKNDKLLGFLLLLPSLIAKLPPPHHKISIAWYL